MPAMAGTRIIQGQVLSFIRRISHRRERPRLWVSATSRSCSSNITAPPFYQPAAPNGSGMELIKSTTDGVIGQAIALQHFRLVQVTTIENRRLLQGADDHVEVR